MLQGNKKDIEKLLPYVKRAFTKKHWLTLLLLISAKVEKR